MRSTNGRAHAGESNGGVGLVMDTLVGPVIVAGSWSFDGRWRTHPRRWPDVPLTVYRLVMQYLGAPPRLV